MTAIGALKARISQDVEFATKPELARRMLTRLLARHSRAAMPWSPRTRPPATIPGCGPRSTNKTSTTSWPCRATPSLLTPRPRRADELAACAPHEVGNVLGQPRQERTPAA